VVAKRFRQRCSCKFFPTQHERTRLWLHLSLPDYYNDLDIIYFYHRIFPFDSYSLLHRSILSQGVRLCGAALRAFVKSLAILHFALVFFLRPLLLSFAMFRSALLAVRSSITVHYYFDDVSSVTQQQLQSARFERQSAHKGGKYAL
jgi:hypothetical protein